MSLFKVQKSVFHLQKMANFSVINYQNIFMVIDNETKVCTCTTI